MNVFKKSFEQFLMYGLAFISNSAIYIGVLMLSSLIFSFIPVVGPILYSIISLFSTVMYLRLMQGIINSNSMSVDRIVNTIPSAMWGTCLLGIIRTVLVFILLIPVIRIALTMSVYEFAGSIYFESFSMTVIPIILITFLVSLLIGFVVELLLGFTGYSIVDVDFESQSFGQRLMAGIKMMNGFRIKYILVQLASVVLILIGLMLFGIGVLVTGPFMMVLQLNLYKEAKEKYLYGSSMGDSFVEDAPNYEL